MARAVGVSPRVAGKEQRPIFVRKVEGRVREFVQRRDVIHRGERALVAVSGGGDSTAMLLILSRLAAEFDWGLTAAHFDHRLRSRAEASGDLAFVQEVCRSLGISLMHGSGDVARRARARGESVEEAARVLRYRFLASRAKAADATVVMMGHTLDDQAETVLLHLVRGSGLGGLAGMRPRSGWPFGRAPEAGRPLLGLRREETARYCREVGITPREDPTNDMLLAMRNRVRHEVLPVLRGLNPRIEEALARLAEAAADDVSILDDLATQALRKTVSAAPSGLALGLPRFRELPAALRRRVVRLALDRLLGSNSDIESVHIEALMELIGSRPGRVSLPRGAVAVRNSRSLRLYRGEPALVVPLPKTRLAVPGVTEVGGWRFEVEEVVPSRRPPTTGSALEVYLDADALGKDPWVRSRKAGDRMRPWGLGGEKKLQDIFVDAKVPRDERDGVPIVVTERGIAWVVGVCLDERAAGGRLGRVVRVRAQRLVAAVPA